MKKSVYDYLKKIDDCHSHIGAIRKVIQTKTRQYNSDMEFYNNIMAEEREKEELIKDQTIISVRFKHILEELSRIWNVPTEEIDVMIKNDYDFSTKSTLYARKNIENFNITKSSSSTAIPFEFVLTKPWEEGETFPIAHSFTTSLRLSDKQSDGKTLGEHLTATMREGKRNTIHVALKFDSLENINVTFPLRQLITTDENGTRPKNDISELLLDISDKCNENYMN
ncbi:MAG: hypothetical protein E7345_02880 [Clostridiales bacterium]|nr:hypothetical protein [Clostridiales bacterium]